MHNVTPLVAGSAAGEAMQPRVRSQTRCTLTQPTPSILRRGCAPAIHTLASSAAGVSNWGPSPSRHGGSCNRQPITTTSASEFYPVASSSDSPDQQVQPLRLVLGASLIPHPDKAHYGGEDAYFISTQGAGALGVADGVGGWQESGINPGDYSKEFMVWAQQYLEGTLQDDENMGGDAESSLDLSAASGTSPDMSSSDSDEVDTARSALTALRTGHKLTRKPGSATACVVRLDAASGELDAANLGDSGFLLIRNSTLLFTSPTLQHFFDCPFQFGCAPEFTAATDTADDASVFRIRVQPGDVLVAGSDGLLDNCWPEEIVAAANSITTGDSVQAAAERLAALAMSHASDPDFESPYIVEAGKQGMDIPLWEKVAKVSFKEGKVELGRMTGGKLDDVTVVVALVEGA